MPKSLISNPPYNLQCAPPPFANLQKRYSKFKELPKNNANYLFILTALEKHEKCVFLLPNGVLSTEQKAEYEIRKYLIESNLIEAIVTLPDNMFESTSIATCIIVFSKIKNTTCVEMIDLRNHFETEDRLQKGQFGGNSHTNRTYKKSVKTLSGETMKRALLAIKNKSNESGFSKSVTIEEIKQNQYNLTLSRYLEFEETIQKTREYKDIVKDLNHIINEKNKCKLVINETLAKTLGFDLNLYKPIDNKEYEKFIYKVSGEKIIKEDYFTATKNKNQFEFKNNSKDGISSILIMILNTWKQHVYFLNLEENRYLAELRDKLLPDLMSGKLEVEE